MSVVKIVIVLLGVLVGASAFAQEVAFASKKELLQAFHRAGFERIIEIDYGDFSNTPFLIHTMQTSEDAYSKGTELRAFSGERGETIRIPALDYMDGKTSWNKSRTNAHILSEVFLCYTPTRWGARLRGITDRFERCFIFPVKIMDVLKAVQSTPKSADSHAGRLGH